MPTDKELTVFICKRFNDIVSRNYKFQMGDDDFQLSTAEGRIMDAISVICDELRKNIEK